MEKLKSLENECIEFNITCIKKINAVLLNIHHMDEILFDFRFG
jgi:hypothetical protein